MITIFIQWVVVKVKQMFCNHKWVNLANHGCPNEPDFRQCVKCHLLKIGWTSHFKANKE